MSRKYIEEMSIKVLVLQANGQAYEDIFADINKKVNSDFKKIKAYGNIGDRKNDGFIPSSGTYFQVYAPEDIGKERTVVKAVSKLEEDFKGLKTHWDHLNPIKHYKFAVNDKLKGCPPPVEQKMAELKLLYPDITFSTYTLDDLIKDYNSLGYDDKQSIVGYIPSSLSLTTVDIPAISRTIEHLKTIVGEDIKPDETYDQEELFAKIKFNNLGPHISELIQKSETQTFLLEDYFSNHQNKKLKTLVRDNLNYIYEEEKEKHISFDNLSGPSSFFSILNKVSTDTSSDSMNASLLLISYYFISCDIYEKQITV